MGALRHHLRFGNNLPAKFPESRWWLPPWEFGRVNIPTGTRFAESEVHAETTDCGWVGWKLLETYDCRAFGSRSRARKPQISAPAIIAGTPNVQ